MVIPFEAALDRTDIGDRRMRFALGFKLGPSGPERCEVDAVFAATG
jgi:hypothetical protein